LIGLKTIILTDERLQQLTEEHIASVNINTVLIQ